MRCAGVAIATYRGKTFGGVIPRRAGVLAECGRVVCGWQKCVAVNKKMYAWKIRRQFASNRATECPGLPNILKNEKGGGIETEYSKFGKLAFRW